MRRISHLYMREQGTAGDIFSGYGYEELQHAHLVVGMLKMAHGC